MEAVSRSPHPHSRIQWDESLRCKCGGTGEVPEQTRMLDRQMKPTGEVRTIYRPCPDCEERDRQWLVAHRVSQITLEHRALRIKEETKARRLAWLEKLFDFIPGGLPQ